MELNGLNFADFPVETGRAVGDEFIARNRAMFPWITEKFQDLESKVTPEASLFYYVHQEGVHSQQKVSMGQDYDMEGDMKKAPGAQAMLENFKDDVLQELGGGSGASTEKSTEDKDKEKEFSVAQGQIQTLKTT